MQTLYALHTYSNICHMDISPANIMFNPLRGSPWDSVTLIDFGFAQEFDAGIAHNI